MSPQTAAIIFVVINLVLITVSVLVSYSSAHSNQGEYSRIYKIYKIAMRVLKRESEDAENAAKAHYKAMQKLIDRRQRRQKIHDKFLQRALEIKENFEWLVRSYRTSNMYARKKGQTPRCFNNEPKLLELPFELNPDNLDWNCPSGDNDLFINFSNNFKRN